MELTALAENQGLLPNKIYWLEYKNIKNYQFTLLKKYLDIQKSNIVLKKIVDYNDKKYIEFEITENFPTLIAIISILVGALSVIGLKFLAEGITNKLYSVKKPIEKKISFIPFIVVGVVGFGVALYFILT